MQVLRCVSHGLTNKEIAYELGMAENTVKNHVNSLMFKLNARDRTQAAHLALSRGLLRVD
jgi:DNA-binding NarL/FixJ family response regulator